MIGVETSGVAVASRGPAAARLCRPRLTPAAAMVLDHVCFPIRNIRMISLTINGAAVKLDCAPDTPLLFALRDAAGLAGTRAGCLVGLCGACTVHLDGEAVRSCCLPAAVAQGRAVTTIDGVLQTPLGMALLGAWSQEGLPGCEQCRAGRIMAAAALLAENSQPTDDDVAAVLGSHPCECGDIEGAGPALRRAARDASMRAKEPPGAAPVDATSSAPAAAGTERKPS